MSARTGSKKREGPGVLERQVNKGVISKSYGSSKKGWRWVFLGMGRARGRHRDVWEMFGGLGHQQFTKLHYFNIIMVA